MPKWRRSSELQTKENIVTLNSKWKKDMMALNVELKKNNDSECQTKDTALNAKLNNGSEH